MQIDEVVKTTETQDKNEPFSEWMGLEDAARYLGLHPKTVERKARLGSPKSGRSGHRYRFLKQWLDDYIINGGQS